VFQCSTCVLYVTGALQIVTDDDDDELIEMFIHHEHEIKRKRQQAKFKKSIRQPCMHNHLEFVIY